MNGKKFVIFFVGLIIVSGTVASILMKKGYDSRPQIPIEAPKK